MEYFTVDIRRALPANSLIRKSCASRWAISNHLSMPAAFSWDTCAPSLIEIENSSTRGHRWILYTGCLWENAKISFKSQKIWMKRIIKINHWRTFYFTIHYFGAFINIRDHMYRTINLNGKCVTYIFDWDYMKLIISFSWAYTKIVYRKWPLILWFSVS